MRFRFYALGVSIIAASLGGYFVHKSYDTAVYTPKEYKAFNAQVGRYDFGAEYNRMLRADPATGEFNQTAYFKARNEVLNQGSSKADLGLFWEEVGPTNVGGRTRAILQDRNDNSRWIIGGVMGGLFMSWDYGETWSRLNTNMTNLNISCIAQTVNGTIIVGTGAGHDSPDGTNSGSSGGIGDGLYRMIDYNNWELLENASVSTPNANIDWAITNQIIADPIDGNTIYTAGKTGLQICTNINDATPTFDPMILLDNGNPFLGNIDDVDITSDGRLLYASSGQRLYMFTKTNGVWGNQRDTAFPAGGRIEIAVAPSDSNVAYLSIADPCLVSVLKTSNGGESWDAIATGGGSFDPFSNPGVNCQGEYDNAIVVYPDDPNSIILGGVHLWGWSQASSNPPVGSWVQLASTNGSPGFVNPFYVHADKHRLYITHNGDIYIGSDGGIGRSKDGGVSWSQQNLGYGVTQFYRIDAAGQTSHEAGEHLAIGGTQDNGSLMMGLDNVPFINSPTHGFELTGGDGFDCAISSMGSTVLNSFTTLYNGQVFRNQLNIQGSFSSSTIFDSYLEGICGPDANNSCGPFYTTIGYWETNYFDGTLDSLVYKNPSDSIIPAGTEVVYPSNLGDGSLLQTFTIPSSIPVDDSLWVPDYPQSKLALANPERSIAGGNISSVWVTNQAINGTLPNPDWHRVASSVSGESYPDQLSGNVFCIEFSQDGNHMFLGMLNGSIFRVSNLLYANDSLTMDVRSASCVLTCTEIGSFGSMITGMGVDPNDPNNVIVTTGGYSATNKNYVARITNAVEAGTNDANIQAIQGDLPGMPVFDAMIHVGDHNTVLLATEYGVWGTNNAFEANPTSVEWTEQNEGGWGVPRVPSYTIKQLTNEYLYPIESEETKNLNYRKIYVGTHGAGIYTTSTLVGIDDIEPKEKEEVAQLNARLFPNPFADVAQLEFTLPKQEDVLIRVFGLNGQLVDEIRQPSMTAGKQLITLDGYNYPAGTYIVNVTAGELSQTMKAIVTE